jgi:hypothetical protein
MLTPEEIQRVLSNGFEMPSADGSRLVARQFSDGTHLAVRVTNYPEEGRTEYNYYSNSKATADAFVAGLDAIQTQIARHQSTAVELAKPVSNLADFVREAANWSDFHGFAIQECREGFTFL